MSKTAIKWRESAVNPLCFEDILKDKCLIPRIKDRYNLNLAMTAFTQLANGNGYSFHMNYSYEENGLKNNSECLIYVDKYQNIITFGKLAKFIVNPIKRAIKEFAGQTILREANKKAGVRE